MHCVIGRLYVIWRLTLYKSSNYGNIYRNKQPRKTIQYYFAIYPRINGRLSKDTWPSNLASFFSGVSLWIFFIRDGKNGKERIQIGTPPSKIECDVKTGVVLHVRQEQYFIGDRSYTSSSREVVLLRKVQKPFSPSAIPNHPRNSKNASDIPKKLRARNIYIMRAQKSFI